MNTNPNAKRILCYGDSNTWGYIPKSGDRYPANVRWTGLLQNGLGDSFQIIEEGLNSRTTTVDDPLFEGKNGKTFLVPCLETQDPFDTIILCLGTNDLKLRFNRTPEQIGAGIEELIQLIQEFSRDPEENRNIKIILVCPAMVDETVPVTQKNYKGAQQKSLLLPAIYESIAKKYKLSFVNLQSLIKPSSVDGIHFEQEDLAVIAQALEKVVKR